MAQQRTDLTDKAIKGAVTRAKKAAESALKRGVPLAPGRTLMMDAAVRAFGVVITERGEASYFLNVRYPGSNNPTRRTLGRVAEMTLQAARDKARAWKEMVGRGIDPEAEAERERRENDRKRENTLSAVAEDFIATLPADERKRDEVARDIRRELVGPWGARPVTEITPRDVIDVVTAIKKRGAPHQARNVLGYARRMFNWAIAQHAYGLDRSPCEPVKPKAIIGRKLARKRVLDDAELQALWKATGELGYPYGPLFRLLLLTGARKSEIAEARWSEIDVAKATLTIPAGRMKSDEAHVTPLTADALAVIQSLPRYEGRKPGDYLFSTTEGRLPVNGFSKAKARLDKAMAVALGTEAVEPFVIHDIRRSMRTNLSALPIPQHVAERIIGHAQPGLIQTYDRFAFLNEKRQGLDHWESRLRSIVTQSGTPAPAGTDNIILLKTARP